MQRRFVHGFEQGFFFNKKKGERKRKKRSVAISLGKYFRSVVKQSCNGTTRAIIDPARRRRKAKEL